MMTPYYEKMAELLNRMSLSPFSDMDKPDINDPGITVNMGIYCTEQSERIVLCSILSEEDTHFGWCLICPSEKYILPVFFSKWHETKDRLEHLVDLMPSVDSLADAPFRKTYLEPLGESWDRFSHLPGICPEEDDDLRSACSIIYTAARAPVENDGQRLAAFAAHTTYLNKYIEFIGQAPVCEDSLKIKEAQRRKQFISGMVTSHLEKRLSTGFSGALSAESTGRIIKPLSIGE